MGRKQQRFCWRLTSRPVTANGKLYERYKYDDEQLHRAFLKMKKKRVTENPRVHSIDYSDRNGNDYSTHTHTSTRMHGISVRFSHVLYYWYTNDWVHALKEQIPAGPFQRMRRHLSHPIHWIYIVVCIEITTIPCNVVFNIFFVLCIALVLNYLERICLTKWKKIK